MDIQFLSPDTLIPYENNPRINDEAVNMVANSIKEFGFQQPIVVDKEGVCHGLWQYINDNDLTMDDMIECEF